MKHWLFASPEGYSLTNSLLSTTENRMSIYLVLQMEKSRYVFVILFYLWDSKREFSGVFVPFYPHGVVPLNKISRYLINYDWWIALYSWALKNHEYNEKVNAHFLAISCIKKAAVQRYAQQSRSAPTRVFKIFPTCNQGWVFFCNCLPVRYPSLHLYQNNF